MPIFDIYNQAHYQRLITASLQTRMEGITPVVRQMVTVVPTDHDKIRLERAEIKAFGRAKFKAFGATPPVYVPRVRYSDNEVELVQIHEMTPIDERLLRKLEDPDKNVSERAGADIITRGTSLRMRNEAGWDYETLNAILTGQFNVVFEDEPDTGLTIDYGYDPTHFVNAETAWSDTENSAPIDEIRAVQQLLADDAGEYGIHFWLNSNTMRGIEESKQVRDLLTGTDRAMYIPERADIVRRLHEPERVTFHVSDSGFREEGYARGMSAHTKYLQDGVIIVTTSDPFEGEPLVEVFDGRVAVPVSQFARPQLRRGAQSWTVLDVNSGTTYEHYASTRVPRINRPECIAILNTGGVPA